MSRCISSTILLPNVVRHNVRLPSTAPHVLSFLLCRHPSNSIKLGHSPDDQLSTIHGDADCALPTTRSWQLSQHRRRSGSPVAGLLLQPASITALVCRLCSIVAPQRAAAQQRMHPAARSLEFFIAPQTDTTHPTNSSSSFRQPQHSLRSPLSPHTRLAPP